MSIALRFKLSLMMFLQFMLVAVFFPQLAAYLGAINVNGAMIADLCVCRDACRKKSILPLLSREKIIFGESGR